MSSEELSLPFSREMQLAVLGYLLSNNQFFLQSTQRLKPEWFIEPRTARVWKTMLGYYQQWKRQPTRLELENCHDVLSLSQAERNEFISTLKLADNAIVSFRLDVIKADLTNWLKSQVLKRGVDRITSTYNAAARDRTRLGEAYGVFRVMADEMERASFEQTPAMSWDDVGDGSFLVEEAAQRKRAVTFGCPALDEKLLPDCVDGRSLQRGDHTLLLGPVNVGKTTVMSSVIAANLQTNAIRPVEEATHILLLSHEGRPLDIKKKLIKSFLAKTDLEMMEMSKTPEGQARLKRARDVLQRSIDYIPLNKPNLSVEEVEVAIRIAQERRIMNYGRGYDLIVDDYPAKLTTQMARGGQLQRRHIDEIIYNVFTQIALEFDCHVLSAIQTNREGSRINQRQAGTEHRLVVKEDVAEAFGPIQTATNVISLNRDLLAEQNNRITFHVCKSRSNMTGWSIVSQTEYGAARSHGIGLMNTYYRGTSTLNEHIDHLLKQYQGQAIPQTYYDT